MQSCNSESSRDSQSDDGSEHFFAPLSATGFSHLGPEKKVISGRSKRLFVFQPDTSLLENRASDGVGSKYELTDILSDLNSIHEYDRVNGFLSAAGPNGAASDAHRSFFDNEESQEQVFSPPLLMDTSLLADAFEDLLDAWNLKQSFHLTGNMETKSTARPDNCAPVRNSSL